MLIEEAAMNPRPRKVIFPVAGLGTRFLPATKITPKEMLPVVDRPLIQWTVEEAAAAGFDHFIFVTAANKPSIVEHFSATPALAGTLSARGKSEAETDALLAAGMPAGARVTQIIQDQPRGLGHAIWCAGDALEGEPFAVILPDDLVHAQTPCLAQMMAAYDTIGGNMVAVEEVPAADTQKYGVIAPGPSDGALVEINALVEKPRPDVAPSNLAVIGRYILQPEIIDVLSAFKLGAGNEIQLTDAIAELIGQVPSHGFHFQGDRFDCGQPNGFLAANMAYALDTSIGDDAAELRHMMKQVIDKFA
jgi:UTP--glucose-1-phosphate uridylyltransferase